jgi:hypothetical protein
MTPIAMSARPCLQQKFRNVTGLSFKPSSGCAATNSENTTLAECQFLTVFTSMLLTNTSHVFIKIPKKKHRGQAML